MTSVLETDRPAEGGGPTSLPPVPPGAVMLTVHIQRYNPELDELPHTATGKIDREFMRRQLS